MSKRFGRNQRRRLRETIEQKDALIDVASDSVRRLRQDLCAQNHENQLILKDFKYLIEAITELQPESALLPPNRDIVGIRFENYERGGPALRLMTRSSLRGPGAPVGEMDMPITLPFRRILFEIERDPTRLGRLAHLWLAGADGTDCFYFIAEETLHKGMPPRMAENIANTIAEKLVHLFNVTTKGVKRKYNW